MAINQFIDDLSHQRNRNRFDDGYSNTMSKRCTHTHKLTHKCQFRQDGKLWKSNESETNVKTSQCKIYFELIRISYFRIWQVSLASSSWWLLLWVTVVAGALMVIYYYHRIDAFFEPIFKIKIDGQTIIPIYMHLAHSRTPAKINTDFSGERTSERYIQKSVSETRV